MAFTFFYRMRRKEDDERERRCERAHAPEAQTTARGWWDIGGQARAWDDTGTTMTLSGAQTIKNNEAGRRVQGISSFL